jgi:sugar phosphate isomerase/epimerase
MTKRHVISARVLSLFYFTGSIIMENVFAVSTNSYHGFSVDEALEGIAAGGFKFVELNAVKGWTEHIMPSMPKEEIEGIKKKLSNLGLSCIALSGHCNLMDQQRLDDFRENMKLAKELGCKYIVSSTGEAHFGKDEVFADDILAENIKTLLPDLKQYGLELVLEIHGKYGTGESLKRIIQKVGSDLVGINYDTGNVVLYGGKPPEEEVKSCVDFVKFVHLKDKIGMGKEWNFPATGKGELKLLEFMNYLKEHGYKGPYSIEIEYTEDFTMNPKKEGDLAIANRAVKDSFDYLASIQ